MRRWISHVFVVMGILVATALQAAEFSQPAGLIREPLVLSEVLPDGQTATLDAFVTRPNGRSAWARDQQEANRRALAFCQQYREKGEAACTLYAAGDRLVVND